MLSPGAAAHLYFYSPAVMRSGRPPGASLDSRRALQHSINTRVFLFGHEHCMLCIFRCVCMKPLFVCLTFNQGGLERKLA